MPPVALQIRGSRALRLINRIGALAKRAGIKPFALDAERIVRDAERRTGFSLDSEPFRTGLDRLVASIESEAALNTFGRIALRRVIERGASSRLEVEREIHRNPVILSQPINEPLFIIGLPRTGTTILQALLARDARHRSPKSWECLLPCPAPAPESYKDNPRIDRVRAEFEQLFALVPDFRKMHYMEADSPQECVGITALNFTSYQFMVQCSPTSYVDWFFHHADQLENMRWHKRFLQFLQSGGVRKPRWLLKSPVHLLRLKEVFAVYPDARIIMTHRDPRELVGSITSLVSSVRSAYSDEEDAARSGGEMLDFWARSFDRFLAARHELDREDQFVDIAFDDFAADQIGTIDRIYARFGWQLDDDSRGRMRDFLRLEPKDKHGAHEYSLEAFGIAQADVTREYAGYLSFLDQLDRTTHGK